MVLKEEYRMFRGQTRTSPDAKAAKSRRKDYEFIGDSKVTLVADTDRAALESLARHFEIPEITLASFRRVGGKRFMCGSRQVFPPKAHG